jgi:ubiquinone/menaquinone biosynthesis C-methylase UbiE
MRDVISYFMQLHEAITLIEKADLINDSPQTWADLGSGNGLFSRALLSLLPADSTVHAVDIKQQKFDTSGIIFHRADFASHELGLPALNGILMANSLHYISDQPACIQRISRYFGKNTGKFILIEYDTDRANPWVPYPLTFLRARELFRAAGYSRVEKIGERASIYQDNPIYAAVITV